MHDIASLYLLARRFALRTRFFLTVAGALLVLGLARSGAAQSSVLPAGASVHGLGTLSFTGLRNGQPVSGGYWYTSGTGNVGYIDAGGLYHAPATPPTPSAVTVGYYTSSGTVQTTVTVTNPVPVPVSLSVNTIYQLSTPVVIFGSSFMPGATVLVNGVSTPTNYLSSAELGITVTLPKAVSGPITLTVQNPAPGASSATITVPSSFANSGITPGNPQVHAAGTVQMAVQVAGVTQTNGYWYVNGTGDVGYVDANAIYHAPLTVPSPNTATIGYYQNGSSITTTATVTNPVPKPTSLSVNTIHQLSTPVIIFGSSFALGATVLVNGVSTPVNYISSSQLGITITFAKPVTGLITLTVQNPAPGASSATITVPSSFSNSGVAPASPQVRAGATLQMSVQIAGVAQTNGYWYVNGTGDVGYVDAGAVYHAPLTVPTPNTATIGYYENGSSMTTTATVLNPVPNPTSSSVSVITQLSTPLALHGSGFLPSSVVYVQGTAMPTTYYSSSWIATTVTLPTAIRNGVTLTVQNPSPGAASGSIVIPSSFPAVGTISPATLSTGWISLQITGTGFGSGTQVLRDGKPLVTTVNSSTSLTATGYLPPWGTSTTATITIVPQPGSVSTGTQTLPIVYPSLAYDTAARFSTQAAFGPRPGLVEHIQQVGLQGFLTEQMAVPGVAYPSGVLPRYPFLDTAATGNPLLRLRVALALESFIDNQALTEEFQSFAPWQQTVEADAFGNFRQLMTDIASNPRMGDFLNLPGNNATTSSSHPNQNFARELMQLFSIGTSMLNDDGTVQTDASGRVIPSYDQNTILDMARVFTGWNFAPTVNANYVAFNIDWSQPLTAQDQYHDHGAKTLFGTVQLPAGQDIVTDRTAALDAIFKHPNVPAFVGRRLIEQLVKSNPTPAYVQRISAIFENNGKGVRGDLSAVVQAILLDPEARAGDTTAVSVSDGYLQDPLLWEGFLMNVLQQTQFDGQVIYLPGKLGQDWWHPVSVFSFYPATFTIPGTTVNSPQWALQNNVTQLHRSQYLYGILTGQTSGFNTDFQANAWLYNAFTTLPDLVDALNHQLFHGQMPTATQTAILNYCSGITNQNQAYTDAIFLALNSDSFNVVH